MYILLAAATLSEIHSTAEWLNANRGAVHGHEANVLITGIGGTLTSYALCRSLARRRPELVIQAGIGGSFTEAAPPGSLAFIKEEILADLGAVGREGFEDIFDLGLAEDDQPPFDRRLLPNPQAAYWRKFGLPLVRGATVNCVSSTPRQVNMIRHKYNPVTESMEGAALHYVCLAERVPFIQLRAVSNLAGDRNKLNWKIPEAVSALNTGLKQVFAGLSDFPVPQINTLAP